jgi:hypothetical protein
MVENFPVSHFKHFSKPFPYFPGGQASQVEELLNSDHFPRGHGVQMAALSELEYIPGSHVVQYADPLNEYVPALHEVQYAWLPLLKLPDRHLT